MLRQLATSVMLLGTSELHSSQIVILGYTLADERSGLQNILVENIDVTICQNTCCNHHSVTSVYQYPEWHL